MLVILVTIICASILAIVFAWYYVKHRYDKYLPHIVCPPTLPMVGHAFEFGDTTTIIPKFSEFMNNHGNFRLILGFDHYLFIHDHKLLEFFLSSNQTISKGASYSFFEKWLGKGLLTSTGSYWKRQRRLITPAFHFKILEEFLDVFERNGKILLQKLKNEVGKSSVDIYPFVTNCALDMICESAMGTSVNAQENSSSEYVQAVKDMCRVLIERSFSPVEQINFLYQFTSNCRAEKRNLKILHDYTNSVIAERREMLIKSIQSGNTTKSDEGFASILDDSGLKKRFAFLDALLQARTPEGHALTDKEIRQEVDTFMFEGHDTTASAISFCLYCLAQNANCQDKVVDELRTIFNESGDGVEPQNRSATYQDLQDMKYLDMVIKETLRLYPSVPAFARNLTSDVQFDGHTYPAGLQLAIFVLGIHNDSKYFANPKAFDPERFSLSNTSNKLPYLYVPFSAGPRNCIDQKFAVLEIKSTVAKVLRNFQLLPAIPNHELQLVYETILKSANGIRIQLKSRKW